MPPRPISSMMRYLPAIRLSIETTGRGVDKVFVKEAPWSRTGVKGVAQLLQKRELSLFSEWHFGHSMTPSPVPMLGS